MTFSLTVLGSSAMYATRERASSGYLLNIDGHNILMDSGGGTWRNLLEQLHYPSLEAVLISHRHPDHTIDVLQAFHARMYGDAQPLPAIPLWGPQEAIDRLVGFSDEIAQTFELNAVDDGDVIDVCGATVTFVRMAHPPVTLGMRVEYGGKTLAYSADTGPAADFERLAGGADVFLCEATFQEDDDEWEGHMTAAQAGAAAARAGVGKLVLTHLPANRDLGISIAEASKTAGSTEVQLAADGLKIEL